MPLVVATPPPNSQSALQLGLQNLSASPAVGRLYVQAQNLSFKLPHPVYELPLIALLPKPIPAVPTLATAQLIGWRFLIHEKTLFPNAQPVAAAELDAGGNEIRHFNFGPFVQSTHLTVNLATPWPQFNGADHEIRVLQVLPLSVVSLWIRRLDGLVETLVPLAPSPSYLTPNQQYSVPAFFAALAAEAARISTYKINP
jgi:hypothetical protein